MKDENGNLCIKPDDQKLINLISQGIKLIDVLNWSKMSEKKREDIIEGRIGDLEVEYELLTAA